MLQLPEFSFQFAVFVFHISELELRFGILLLRELGSWYWGTAGEILGELLDTGGTAGRGYRGNIAGRPPEPAIKKLNKNPLIYVEARPKSFQVVPPIAHEIEMTINLIANDSWWPQLLTKWTCRQNKKWLLANPFAYKLDRITIKERSLLTKQNTCMRISKLVGAARGSNHELSQ